MADDGEWSITTICLIAVSAAAALFTAGGFALAYVQRNRKQALAEEFNEVFKRGVFDGHTGKLKEGSLFFALHPKAQKKCEKPFVLALERAIHKRLGPPTIVHTATLTQEPAPEGFERVNVQVSFEKDVTCLVDLSWALIGPSKGRIGSFTVDPEDAPLDLYEHLNSSSFEQKTDSFITHLFRGSTDVCFGMMHPSLQEKLSAETMRLQRDKLCLTMGVAPSSYEPDATYHSAKVTTLDSGLRVMRLEAGLIGDEMNCTATFMWMLEEMSSRLVKFDVTTTGKKNKATVFVDENYNRIDHMDA
eukprot:TRINITY_DN6533_c0_g1_i1.p1 TRINITY_DN6533_c0_g1~~TRINITY_DN6533_c0_g1_i1.p1  ORF type:complete len:332 (+),score=111.87 TRINITY_DN6533_c0_g1_i1:89-997(+)